MFSIVQLNRQEVTCLKGCAIIMDQKIYQDITRWAIGLCRVAPCFICGAKYEDLFHVWKECAPHKK